jgi:hypothetical protein
MAGGNKPLTTTRVALAADAGDFAEVDIFSRGRARTRFIFAAFSATPHAS